jgi:4-hydroxybenzoate polyprenyltransferase
MKYLKLIRYQNLLILAFMQLIFRYGFLKLQNIPLALTDWQYLLLVLSTVLIAAAGYVINNDQDSDLENKPNRVVIGKSITESAAYNIYAVLNISGVVIGFYLSNVIVKPSLLLFYFDSRNPIHLRYQFKANDTARKCYYRITTLFSVVIIGVFDLYPAINAENQLLMASLFSILLDYAIFAFVINLIREIVKDLEDINGDTSQGMKTLAIVLGILKTTKLVFALGLISIITFT